MTIILFDTPQSRKSFYPLSLTRPLADMRHGIFTNRERWEKITNTKIYALSEGYLVEDIPEDESYLYVDAQIIYTEKQINKILNLCVQGNFSDGIACREEKLIPYPYQIKVSSDNFIDDQSSASIRLYHPCQLSKTNEQAIKDDFELITRGRISQPIHSSNILFGKENIFIEEGAVVRACTINAENGPVYIGRNTLVMEGTTICGSVAICNNAVVKMGTKLYAGTTIGPHCTAGGEIKNSMIMGYSNKAHDGYLGDSIIGEWCNLGAGTSNSNVKNTAGDIKMWSGIDNDFIVVGTKAGLIMGDYSRSAINTSFNTGTVVGVCCNVFDTGFPSKHIASFSWGNKRYELDKALTDIERWKQMKGETLNEKETEMIRYLFKMEL